MKYWEIEFKNNEISKKNAQILLLSDPSLSPFNNEPLIISENKWILWSNEKEDIVKNFNHSGIKMIKSTSIDFKIPFSQNTKNKKYMDLIIDRLFYN